MLKGKTGAVQHFAEHVIAERGVRHGRVVMMPTDAPRAAAKPGPQAQARALRRGSAVVIARPARKAPTTRRSISRQKRWIAGQPGDDD